MADVSSIITVLTPVAINAAKGLLDQNVQDAYQNLLKVVKKKFTETQDEQVAELVLEKYEGNPVIWKATLEGELSRAKVDQDKEIDESFQKLAALVTPRDAAYERIATAANATRKQLEQIYEQGREQAKQWSQLSLIAAILGFLVILGGIIAVLTVNTTVGVITSIAGVIPEAAAVLFFQQARDANKRIDSISDKLLEVDKVNRAIEIALTVDDTSQNHFKEIIMLQVLGLPSKK